MDDNIIIQIFSFAIQAVILFKWIATFFIKGLHMDYLPAFGSFKGVYVCVCGHAFADRGSSPGQGALLGQCVLNYAFVMTVPSWCNEKKRSSNVNKTIWSSVTFATSMYLAIGVLGAMAFPGLGKSGEDILTAINTADGHNVFDQIR